jgi:hypothetical protein
MLFQEGNADGLKGLQFQCALPQADRGAFLQFGGPGREIDQGRFV